MDMLLVDQLVQLLENSSLKEIEHTTQFERIRLVKGDGAAMRTREPSVGFIAPGIPVVEDAVVSDVHRVEASLVGMFYRSPGPDQPPFVQVGDFVEEGQVLGIVEAMKMLNQVEAGVRGRVKRVACEDGQSVECGALLFELTPVGADDV